MVPIGKILRLVQIQGFWAELWCLTSNHHSLYQYLIYHSSKSFTCSVRNIDFRSRCPLFSNYNFPHNYSGQDVKFTSEIKIKLRKIVDIWFSSATYTFNFIVGYITGHIYFGHDEKLAQAKPIRAHQNTLKQKIPKWLKN